MANLDGSTTEKEAVPGEKAITWLGRGRGGMAEGTAWGKGQWVGVMWGRRTGEGGVGVVGVG